MRRSRALIMIGLAAALAAAASGAAAAGAQTQPAKPAADALFDRAFEAWDTGDYPAALRGFETLLAGPDAGRFFERIALITGELYEVKPVSPDGRDLRYSPNGRWACFDTGSRPDMTIHVLDAANGLKPAAEVKGAGPAVFSPDGNAIAFLRVDDTPEMTALRKKLAEAGTAAAPDYAQIMRLRSELGSLEARTGRIVVRDLASGSERTAVAEGMAKSSPVFAADGTSLFFAGAVEAETDSNSIYAVSLSAGEAGPAPRPVTSGPGYKVSPMAVPGGKFLVYSVTARPPFPRPAPAGTGPGQAQGQRAGSPGRSGGPGAPPVRKFGIVNLLDGSLRTVDGTAAAVAPDGSSLAVVTAAAGESVLSLLPLEGGGEPKVLKRTPESIGTAVFSPDGSRLAFEMSWTRNQEIFLIGADGRNEVRLTRDILDDRAPRFLGPDRVLVVRGEPRHSTSYLYDLKTLDGVRLFHNNTVRTVCPEYEWAPDPSGRKILIAADRDGDTMSPETGVYLLDLDRTIGLDALKARVRDSLRAENALRAKGEAMFKPIAAAVRARTSGVSITRLYGYEKALFDFDSKHVTKPGNRKAAEFIFRTLESFGYAPEYQDVRDRPNKTANVVAVLRGTVDPSLYYVMSSHYDSNASGPGADDNSSATAVLLETARLLAGHPLPVSVVFAAFTGEESGFWGSREFVRRAKEKGLRILGAMNNDMIGWTNDNRLDDTIRYSNAGIRDVLHASAIGFSRLITYDSRYIKSTDSVPLFEAWGNVVGGLGSYPIVANPYYHLPADLLETVNQELVAEASRMDTAAIMLLASSPSPVAGLKLAAAGPGALEVSWTANPEKDIASYRVTWEAAVGKGKARMVKGTGTKLTGLAVRPGETVRVTVKAVNSRGLVSWDASPAVWNGK